MKEDNQAVIKAINMYGRVPEMWELLDEIERLNKKIEQYENPEDMTLMFMWCDEKAKDEIKRLNNIISKVKVDINNMKEIIRQQPSEDSDTDEWITNRLNGLLYIIKGSEKE